MLRRDNPLRRLIGFALTVLLWTRNQVRIRRLRRQGATISAAAYVSRKSRLTGNIRNLIVEDWAVVDDAHLYLLDQIVIGRNSIIGAGAYLCTGTHDVDSEGFELRTAPIRIGADVWIATGATILPGVNIGDASVVGAMAVVTKDVEKRTIVVGNPACKTRMRGCSQLSIHAVRLASVDVKFSYQELMDSLRQAMQGK